MPGSNVEYDACLPQVPLFLLLPLSALPLPLPLLPLPLLPSTGWYPNYQISNCQNVCCRSYQFACHSKQASGNPHSNRPYLRGPLLDTIAVEKFKHDQEKHRNRAVGPVAEKEKKRANGTKLFNLYEQKYSQEGLRDGTAISLMHFGLLHGENNRK